VWKSILMCFINGNLTFIAFYVPITYTPLFHPHEMTVEGLPTTMTLIGTVLFCMICEDTTFYFVHRIMHHPSLY
jgi:sterol desaturase/sphingolipid hydroxylase (fatty acid hydroxylase superfamily)